jgi:hypothetical protein
MNGEDPFESRLRCQRQRPIPPGWRAEILTVARQAASSRTAHSALDSQPSTSWSFLSTLYHQLSAIFWPHPAAWAGLAAAWVLVLGLNFSVREPARQDVAKQVGPPSPQLRQMLRQQEQMLAELVGPMDRTESLLPKAAVPQPRSQRREEFMNA